jgi:hypothetical protein
MVSEQDGQGNGATLKRSGNLARSSANLGLVSPRQRRKVGAQCRGLERPKAAMASVSLRLPPLLKSTADRRVARGDGHRILVVPGSSALRASLNRRKAGTHPQIVQFGPGGTLNPFP